MTIYKQIQEKFWQNDFVLELTPEERYFYMYLITNTMTTKCGIYRFNLKLAVLETGLSAEVIKKHLNTFEGSKKIIISKTSKEIMIVNWLKHNFKMNKRNISCINAELKEVKDKELLRQFNEICKMKQYPTDEIFKDVILPLDVKEEANNNVQAMRLDPGQNIVQAMPEAFGQQETDTEEPSQVEDNNIVQAIPEASNQQKVDTEEISQDETNESKETVKMLFTGLKGTSTDSRAKKRRVLSKEEIEVECNDIVVEDDIENTIRGTAVASWNFSDSGGVGTFAANSA